MNKWPGYVIAYIDMLLTLVVIGIVFMVIVDVKEQTFLQKPVCLMAIDASWSKDYNVDVDLWAAGPDGLPVGYSARESPTLYIGADDRGYKTDEVQNDERICARMVPNGEYIVNVHMFGNPDSKYPVPVFVEVALVDPASATQLIIISTTVELRLASEELTVARFNIKNGEFVPGSLYDLPFILRGPSAGGMGR